MYCPPFSKVVSIVGVRPQVSIPQATVLRLVLPSTPLPPSLGLSFTPSPLAGDAINAVDAPKSGVEIKSGAFDYRVTAEVCLV